MNERIRELAEQAKIDYELLPEIAREPVWIALDDELEKFAKLIVRECAELCDRFQERDVGMQPAECAGAIRQMFGVEE